MFDGCVVNLPLSLSLPLSREEVGNAWDLVEDVVASVPRGGNGAQRQLSLELGGVSSHRFRSPMGPFPVA